MLPAGKRVRRSATSGAVGDVQQRLEIYLRTDASGFSIQQTAQGLEPQWFCCTGRGEDPDAFVLKHDDAVTGDLGDS